MGCVPRSRKKIYIVLQRSLRQRLIRNSKSGSAKSRVHITVASIARHCINVNHFAFARLGGSRDILSLCLIQLRENKERKIERFSR